MDFAKTLTRWYLRNKRNLPWRETSDPYFIWLSEIMLQQTRVAQGLPYYFKFTESFPTVFELARADEQTVLKLWQGLGYYSRARNLHQTAQFVAFELGGKFPTNYNGLLKLKGVGEYTAAAIASFAFGEETPVVDGNVFRVLARYFGIETDIAKPVAKKEFTALAKQLMKGNDPALFNQAIMEFGSLQCVPANPDCGICPLNSGCVALQKRIVNKLPVKAKKAKPRDRHFNYLVFEDASGYTKIQKRTDGIWQGLHEFPLIETETPAEYELLKSQISDGFQMVSVSEIAHERIIHKLSHQNLHLRFWKIVLEGELENGISPRKLQDFPFPVAIHNFISRNWI